MSIDGGGTNGWGEWSKHVLLELERLNKNHQQLREQLQGMREDIVALKIKAGLWGFAAGVIPVMVTIAIAVAVKLVAG